MEKAEKKMRKKRINRQNKFETTKENISKENNFDQKFIGNNRTKQVKTKKIKVKDSLKGTRKTKDFLNF